MLYKIIILVILSLYLCLGAIPYYLSQIHGDYPGPKEIYSNNALTKSHIDYLLIHGAAVDARIWNGVLQRNPDKSMLAISLGQHEDGVKYANPYTVAQELVDYLKTHKVRRAIIGHSTASLWIAEAYFKCPECFKNVPIILLAPNLGQNIMPSDLEALQKLNRFSFILPDPMLNLSTISSCEGGDKNSYNICKKVYAYGRLFLFNSIKYYTNLVRYSVAPQTIAYLDYFLKNDKDNVLIYISDSDKVLDPKVTLQLIEPYTLKYKVLPGLSHIMLANNDKLWLK